MKPVGGVLLPRRVLDLLEAQRQDRLPQETGGFLLGLRRGPHIEIVDATTAGPADCATTVSFERIDLAHQHRAEAVWESSGGLVGLVGDWHTHPVGPSIPSGTDRRAWRILASSLRNEVVGIILGDGGMDLFKVPRTWSLLGPRRYQLAEQSEHDLIFTVDGGPVTHIAAQLSPKSASPAT